MTIGMPGALGQNSLKAAVAALQDDAFLPSLLQQATSYKAADDFCWQFLVPDMPAGQLHGKAICDFDYNTASTDPLNLQLRTCQDMDSLQDKLLDAVVATQAQPMFELAVEESLQVSSPYLQVRLLALLSGVGHPAQICAWHVRCAGMG